LQGDGGKSLRSGFDSDVLFSLQSLVQSIRKAPSRHLASGKFIHDDNLVIDHDVFLIVFKERKGLEQLTDIVQFLTLVHKPFCGIFFQSRTLTFVDVLFGINLADDLIQGAYDKEVCFPAAEHFAPFIAEIHAILAFFHHKEEIIVQFVHLFITQIDTFSILHQSLE